MVERFDKLISGVADAIVNPLIALMFGVALVVFLWGVFEMIRGADSEDARDIGKKHILWGVIGMAIMVSAYGIIRLIAGTVGVPSPL